MNYSNYWILETQVAGIYKFDNEKQICRLEQNNAIGHQSVNRYAMITTFIIQNIQHIRYF